MLILTRNTLFSMALTGLVSATAAAQEPYPAPPVSIPAPPGSVSPQPQAASKTTVVANDRPGIIHVSDCPPEDSWAFGGRRHGGRRPEYVPPTSGWDPPGVRPMQRSFVPYHKFFPDAWTGVASPAQVRAPTVYMPTDTTQLGFYYQHVPTWHAYAGMLPPVPRPSDWHYVYREGENYAPWPVADPQPAPVDEPLEVAPDVPDLLREAPAPPVPDRSAGRRPNRLPLLQ